MIQASRNGKGIKQSIGLYLFISPYMILFFIFTVLPVLLSVFYSFTSYNILQPAEFVGFANYRRLFLDDDVFITAIKNTIILAAITGPAGYILCFVFAWFINELSPKVRALMTLLFYAPTISGNVYLMWGLLFSGDSHGYINGLLMKLNLITEPILWFQNTKYMMPLIVMVALWSSLGTSFLAFIAGLQGIDKSLFEAGAVDGIHNRWQELWYITLPSMRPQLMFGAVMSITGAFGIGSVITALCGNPSTDYAVHTMVNHLEDYGGARFEMGYASAIAVLLFVLMIACNMMIQRILSKIGT